MEARLSALTKRFNVLAAGIKDLEAAIISSRNAAPTVQASGAPVAGAAPAEAKWASVDPATLTELQPCAQDTPAVARLRRYCIDKGLYSAVFRWVPSNYYQENLQWRRDALDAATIGHLCKTIVMENTHCTRDDCSVRENSRFYMIVYRYVDKFDANMIMRVIRDLNEGLGKKKFNFRLADPDRAMELTGFSHGSVCPFGTTRPLPVVLSSEIVSLAPNYMWMGGGHVDCKVRVDVRQFIDVINPIVAPITTALTQEELEQIAD